MRQCENTIIIYMKCSVLGERETLRALYRCALAESDGTAHYLLYTDIESNGLLHAISRVTVLTRKQQQAREFKLRCSVV